MSQESSNAEREEDPDRGQRTANTVVRGKGAQKQKGEEPEEEGASPDGMALMTQGKERAGARGRAREHRREAKTRPMCALDWAPAVPQQGLLGAQGDRAAP